MPDFEQLLSTQLSAPPFHEARLSRLKSASDASVDIVVIGGGVHGAFVALTAALSGYSVLLFEKHDYAFGTSSRSSKLLHGGVRYLEQKNFALVYEALRERDLLLSLAPHLTRPIRFLFPVIPARTPPAWQLSLGFGLYDLLSRVAPHSDNRLQRFSHHRRSDGVGDGGGDGAGAAAIRGLSQLGLEISSAFGYSDAQVDDARLVVETIVAAVEKGAICLNHTAVTGITRLPAEKQFLIRWQSNNPTLEGESRARVVFNCAGPWVEELSTFGAGADVIYSRGAHLLFNVPWEREGLILPTGEKGRYYFVLPYFAPGSRSTLVGTTDQITRDRPDDPQATSAEIAELLGYLQRDLPQSELKAQNMYATLCGIRVLKSHGKEVDKVSAISRSHQWIDRDGLFSLYGGKYTTARSTAVKGVATASAAYFHSRKTMAPISCLPGGIGYDYQSLLALLQERFPKASEQERTRAVRRFGSRVLSFNAAATPTGLIAEQLNYAIGREHALTRDDILRRRLVVSLLAPKETTEYTLPAGV